MHNEKPKADATISRQIGICLLALCTKIAQWEETNLFFDGSSCGGRASFRCRTHALLATDWPLTLAALVILAVALYASVSVPNLRVLALQPIDVAQSTLYGRFRAWLHQPMAAPAEALAIPEPLDEQLRFDVLSLLCASNNLIIGALVGVLLFQGAQAYAHRQAANELKKIEAAEKAAKSQ